MGGGGQSAADEPIVERRGLDQPDRDVGFARAEVELPV
jgi:hypothetical protein